MERLTVYTPDGYESINPVDLCLDEYSDINFERILDKLGAYEDFEEIFREKMPNAACDILSDKEEFGKWLDRNKWIAKKCDEWARAEEQGRLVKLPCKIGDIIYAIGVLGFETVEEYKVIKVDYHSNLATDRSEFYIVAFLTSNPKADIGFFDKEFGNNVFLTKSEAEAKLKELRHNND